VANHSCKWVDLVCFDRNYFAIPAVLIYSL